MATRTMKQFVQPVPYSGHLKPLDDETIKEFNLNEREISTGNFSHKFNFIDQNKRIAAHFRQQRLYMQTLQSQKSIEHHNVI